MIALLTLGLALLSPAGAVFGCGGSDASAMATGVGKPDCCQHDSGDAMAGHGYCAMTFCQATAATGPAVLRQAARPRPPRALDPTPYQGPRSAPDTPPPRPARFL